MAAISVEVHFDIRNPLRQHRAVVFDGPDRVAAVARAPACYEGRRRILRNWRGRTVTRKGRRTRIDNADEIGTGGDSGKGIGGVVVLLIEILEEHSRGSR